MKINFDNFKAVEEARPSGSSQSPIKISIQSPVYSSVVRDMSPHNYKSELNNINSLINLPVEVSRFLEKEIEKQIIATEKQEKKLEKASSKMSINFLSRASSQLLKSSKQKPIFQKQATPKQKTKALPTPKQHIANHQPLNRKKHKCQNTPLETQVRHTLHDIEQLTYRPHLYPSKVTEKVCRIRKQNLQYGQKCYSIYDSLYNQATERKIKMEMTKTLQNNQINQKRKIKANNFGKSKFSYVSLSNRMNTILENREIKRKSKLDIDQTTGRQLFKPDTSYSKQSYRLYFNSLSKQKLVSKRMPRQPLFAQQKQAVHMSTSKPNMIDNLTIEYFTQIFYPSSSISSLSSSVAVPEIIPENPLRKEEFLILHSFLHEIQELESRKVQTQTTASSVKNSTVGAAGGTGAGDKVRGFISKEEFQIRFSKFYKMLSLHDRQVLRRQTVNRRKKDLQNHMIKEQNQRVFRPAINVRSSSLDNLAKGHSKDIYYI